MKISVIIILFFGLVSLSTCIPQNGQQSEHEIVKREASKEDNKAFRKWMKKHNKRYESKEKQMKAMEKWLMNKKSCDDHNKLHDQGKASYRKGLSKYADLNAEEAKKAMTGLIVPEEEKKRSKRDTSNKKDFPEGPKSVFWKDQLGPAEDQEGCGSCWAFTTAGIINAALRRKDNSTNILVSPQQMVDCSTQNRGCNGGWMDSASQYAIDNGLTSEDEYPYIDDQGTCEYSKEDKLVDVKNYTKIYTNGDEEYLKNIVGNVGVVAATLCFEPDLQFYESGVYKHENCCTDNDHAILLVGYGTDEKEGDYWIIKSSWGPTWGQNGMAKFARNNNNMCNIAWFTIWDEVSGK